MRAPFFVHPFILIETEYYLCKELYLVGFFKNVYFSTALVG